MSSSCGSDLKLHAKRILLWRLNQVVPTEREQRLMTQANVPQNTPILRSFLAWRRTNLLVGLPITLFSAIWTLWGYVEDVTGTDTIQYLNPFGIFLWSLPYFNAPILFGAVLISCYYWNQWRLTRTLLKLGWGLSFFLPFLPALFPIELLLNAATIEYYNSSVDAYAELQVWKLQLALQYVFVVLPLIITFPSGAVRAAVRIRGLLPQSSLTSWVLVLSAPFYSLLILTGLVVLLQLLGDPLLLVGTTLIALSPWMYVIFRKWYIQPATTPQHEVRLDRIQKCTGLINLCGLILVLAWAITSGVVGTSDEQTGGWISYADVVRLVFTGFGNGLITSIIFGDAFLRMTVTNWKMDLERRHTDLQHSLKHNSLQQQSKMVDLDEEEDGTEHDKEKGDQNDASDIPPGAYITIDDMFAIIEETIRKSSYKRKSSTGEVGSSLNSSSFPPAAAAVAATATAAGTAAAVAGATATTTAAVRSSKEAYSNDSESATDREILAAAASSTAPATNIVVPSTEADVPPPTVEQASSPDDVDPSPPPSSTTPAPDSAEAPVVVTATSLTAATAASPKPKKSKSKKVKVPTKSVTESSSGTSAVPELPTEEGSDAALASAAAAITSSSKSNSKKSSKKAKDSKKVKKKKKENIHKSSTSKGKDDSHNVDEPSESIDASESEVLLPE